MEYKLAATVRRLRVDHIHAPVLAPLTLLAAREHKEEARRVQSFKECGRGDMLDLERGRDRSGPSGGFERRETAAGRRRRQKHARVAAQSPAAIQDDVLSARRQHDLELHFLARLFVNERVRRARGIPDSVCAHAERLPRGLVDGGVDEHGVVGRPRHGRPSARNDLLGLCEIAEVLDVNRVDAAADRVARIRKVPAVRTHRDGAEVEVGRACGKHVLVENEDLGDAVHRRIPPRMSRLLVDRAIHGDARNVQSHLAHVRRLHALELGHNGLLNGVRGGEEACSICGFVRQVPATLGRDAESFAIRIPSVATIPSAATPSTAAGGCCWRRRARFSITQTATHLMVSGSVAFSRYANSSVTTSPCIVRTLGTTFG
eukprot:Opistho-1_new@28107